MTDPKKKRGRPPKPQAERAVSVNFTMRLRPHLMEELRASAEAANITISAEAERRLSQPYVGDLARILGAAITNIEENAKSSWIKSQSVKEKCRTVIEQISNILLGHPIDVREIQNSVGRDISRMEKESDGSYNALFGGSIRSPEELQGIFDRIDAQLEAQDVALSTLRALKEDGRP